MDRQTELAYHIRAVAYMLSPVKKGNEKHAYFHKSWAEIKGRKIKLLKHVFALYSLPVLFSKIFWLATLAQLRFILHLKNASMQCALPTPFVFF